MNIKQIKDTINNKDFYIPISIENAPMFFDYKDNQTISTEEMKEVITDFFDNYYSNIDENQELDEDTLRDNISEYCDSEVNPYHYNRLQWLSYNLDNAQYIDDVVRDYGIGINNFDFFTLLGQAMCYANEQAFNEIIAMVEKAISDNK